jgi:hypothetical protein
VFTARYEINLHLAPRLKMSRAVAHLPSVPSLASCGVTFAFTSVFKHGRAKSRAVSCQTLKKEARVQSQDSACEICGGQSGIATGISPVSMIPPMLHTHLHLALTRRTKPGNLLKGMFFGKGETLERKVVCF